MNSDVDSVIAGVNGTRAHSFHNIPQDIRECPQWVLWDYVDRGGSKPTKLPRDPKTGFAASVTDASTWASFDQAVSCYEHGRCDGIGFVFTGDDPYVFIDLDDAKGDPRVAQRQRAMVEAFDSYTEISPSGTGVHIIVKGDTPIGRRREDVELYSRERFATFTGNVIRNVPIRACQPLITILHDELGSERAATAGVQTDQPETLTDAQVIELVVRDPTLAAYYYSDPATYQGDNSAADLALCNGLAARSGNRAQVERILLASPRGNREKVQRRADYRQRTIEAAFDQPDLAPVNITAIRRLWQPASPGFNPILASSFEGKPVPERDWHVSGIISANNITTLNGDGGAGKSTIGLQLTASTALGRPWIGLPILRPGKALFLTAEDELDEVHRRLARIATAEQVPLSAFSNLAIASLAGQDALLAAPLARGRQLAATPLYGEVRAYIEAHRPTLVVLDTLADLFGGDEIDRAQARQFITLLRALAIEFRTAILLLAHPSQNGMTTGSGSSGSTAWNNSVRSRLYMRPEQERSNVQLIEIKKSNYGAAGEQIRVVWHNGVFISLGMATFSEHKHNAELDVDKLFQELLAEFEARGQQLSPKVQSRTRYAPKLMASHAKAGGVSADGFYKAMLRLLSQGRLREREIVENRRPATIIEMVQP